MLTAFERRARYAAQNGSHYRLTPAQQRRIKHKANHQLVEAYHARQARAEQRAQAREERKKRLAGLVASR